VTSIDDRLFGPVETLNGESGTGLDSVPLIRNIAACSLKELESAGFFERDESAIRKVKSLSDFASQNFSHLFRADPRAFFLSAYGHASFY
jgi:hypothetical protein